MDPLQRLRYQSKRKQAAIDKATKPTLYEFSTRRIDSQGLRPGTNAQPPQNPQHDLRGNLIAPDAPRASFANTMITLGTVSRISDNPLTKEDQESIRNGQVPRCIKFGGQRTVKKGAITSAKYKFWSALTDVYEGPLLPASSSTTDNDIGHPSSDLINALIKFAANHYASRGQLRPRYTPPKRRTTKSNSGATQATQNPSVSAAHLAKFLTLDRAFDATAAHAIGMIVQELVRESVTALTPEPQMEMGRKKRKPEEPRRYTSPSLTLSKRRAKASPASRSSKPKKREGILRKVTPKSPNSEQLADAILTTDNEANALGGVSEDEVQHEVGIC